MPPPQRTASWVSLQVARPLGEYGAQTRATFHAGESVEQKWRIRCAASLFDLRSCIARLGVDIAEPVARVSRSPAINADHSAFRAACEYSSPHRWQTRCSNNA